MFSVTINSLKLSGTFHDGAWLLISTHTPGCAKPTSLSHLLVWEKEWMPGYVKRDPGEIHSKSRIYFNPRLM